MRPPKKGDMMLAEVVVSEEPHPQDPGCVVEVYHDAAGYPVLYEMPPVPPEKLLEELEKVWEFVHWCQVHTELDGAPLIKAPQLHMSYGEATELRSQRLAASQPTYQEGQEVWVKVRVVSHYKDDSMCVRPLTDMPIHTETDQILAAARMRVHPDDIMDLNNIVSEETE